MAWRIGSAPVYVVYAPQNEPALLFAGRGALLGIPMPIFVFAAAALLVYGFLSRTSIGRFIYAQGDNPEAAPSGIALRPLIMLEHLLVAALAWLAGLVWIGQTGSMQMTIVQGTQIFDVILVVVLGGISLIGGRGGVFSVAVGCALIGTLLNAFTIMDVNSEVQNIIRGVVLLGAIILDNWLHPRDDETARQGETDPLDSIPRERLTRDGNNLDCRLLAPEGHSSLPPGVPACDGAFELDQPAFVRRAAREGGLSRYRHLCRRCGHGRHSSQSGQRARTHDVRHYSLGGALRLRFAA